MNSVYRPRCLFLRCLDKFEFHPYLIWNSLCNTFTLWLCVYLFPYEKHLHACFYLFSRQTSCCTQSCHVPCGILLPLLTVPAFFFCSKFDVTLEHLSGYYPARIWFPVSTACTVPPAPLYCQSFGINLVPTSPDLQYDRFCLTRVWSSSLDLCSCTYAWTCGLVCVCVRERLQWLLQVNNCGKC